MVISITKSSSVVTSEAYKEIKTIYCCDKIINYAIYKVGLLKKWIIFVTLMSNKNCNIGPKEATNAFSWFFQNAYEENFTIIFPASLNHF